MTVSVTINTVLNDDYGNISKYTVKEWHALQVASYLYISRLLFCSAIIFRAIYLRSSTKHL